MGVSGRAGEAIGAVFQALLEAALRDAAAGAFEDEEEDEGTGVNGNPLTGALLQALFRGMPSNQVVVVWRAMQIGKT